MAYNKEELRKYLEENQDNPTNAQRLKELDETPDDDEKGMAEISDDVEMEKALKGMKTKECGNKICITIEV